MTTMPVQGGTFAWPHTERPGHDHRRALHQRLRQAGHAPAVRRRCHRRRRFGRQVGAGRPRGVVGDHPRGCDRQGPAEGRPDRQARRPGSTATSRAASSPRATPTVSTPFSLYVTPETVQLTVRVKDRLGNPANRRFEHRRGQHRLHQGPARLQQRRRGADVPGASRHLLPVELRQDPGPHLPDPGHARLRSPTSVARRSRSPATRPSTSTRPRRTCSRSRRTGPARPRRASSRSPAPGTTRGSTPAPSAAGPTTTAVYADVQGNAEGGHLGVR